MNNTYILVQGTVGWMDQGYQEIQNGYVQRITDMDGNTVDLPEHTEYHVVDANPVPPAWGA